MSEQKETDQQTGFTARQIIDKMKEYKKEPKSIRAMGEMLYFLGIMDGPNLAEMAIKEIREDIKYQDLLRMEYNRYLSARKAVDFIPFEKFKVIYEQEKKPLS